MAFMVVGMKQSVLFVVQAIPEVTYEGQWLCENISTNIENLAKAGFVTDNHSSNNAFTSLIKLFKSDSRLYSEHPANNGKRTYMLCDTVHLAKNIRNNLLTL